MGELAAAQHGLVTIKQLTAIGVNRRLAARWADAGRLYRVHDGVYAVGHPPLNATRSLDRGRPGLQ